VVNGKIYAIGGALTYPGGPPLSTVEEYDPATDTWTRKADMPTARAYLSTSAVNGKIYAIGGTLINPAWYRGISTVEEYNPATNTPPAW
jgi:N-acetylneuraminic acid mutarotase